MIGRRSKETTDKGSLLSKLSFMHQTHSCRGSLSLANQVVEAEADAGNEGSWTSLSKILKMALPAVKKQQNRLPAKAAEKDKEEDFFENKKSRHNQLSKPLQEEWFILKMIAPVFSFLSLLKYFINTNS